MGVCFFTSDLHGRIDRYGKLFDCIRAEQPQGVFLGGDLLPHAMDGSWRQKGDPIGFVGGFLAPRLAGLKREMGVDYPEIFLILGNDDPFVFVPELEEGQDQGLWNYVHSRSAAFENFTVYGYNCVPPTPFLLKDWERYDVSRFTDPGCVAPEDGSRTDDLTERELRLATIRQDLADLTGSDDLGSAILLFHSPPYKTNLDRADLDGKSIDHAPLDPHVGSIAIRELIETRAPLVSLHGHVHESPLLRGTWRDLLGSTHAFCGAHSGPELALVRFDPADPGSATRELL